MIFSDKIYKINNGKNATLFKSSNESLSLYLFDKTLRKYSILLNNEKNCVFSKEYNYEKIIQLNDKTLCLCSNKFITILNEEDI